MLDLTKLSISWIDELNIANNQVKIKAIALDKIIQIECIIIIFMSVFNQDEDIGDNGNVYEINHNYRTLNSNELNHFGLCDNYSENDFFNVINVWGDYNIQVVCREIKVIELGIYPEM